MIMDRPDIGKHKQKIIDNDNYFSEDCFEIISAGDLSELIEYIKYLESGTTKDNKCPVCGEPLDTITTKDGEIFAYK